MVLTHVIQKPLKQVICTFQKFTIKECFVGGHLDMNILLQKLGEFNHLETGLSALPDLALQRTTQKFNFLVKM